MTRECFTIPYLTVKYRSKVLPGTPLNRAHPKVRPCWARLVGTHCVWPSSPVPMPCWTWLGWKQKRAFPTAALQSWSAFGRIWSKQTQTCLAQKARRSATWIHWRPWPPCSMLIVQSAKQWQSQIRWVPRLHYVPPARGICCPASRTRKRTFLPRFNLGSSLTSTSEEKSCPPSWSTTGLSTAGWWRTSYLPWRSSKRVTSPCWCSWRQQMPHGKRRISCWLFLVTSKKSR